jgi:flagellin
MAMVVNTNIASLNAQRNLGMSNSQLSKSLERLSSGMRINRAADDAAGLAIATKFQGQVRGLGQAVRNVNNAVSLVQTAEAGINTLTNILQRLRELAVQSSSDDNTVTDRGMLTSEADNLISEFTRVASTSEFNTSTLLDGTFSGKYFQVGANYNQLVTFNIGDARGKSIGGRAQYDADVTDGLATAVDANFGGSEFKINAAGVQATNATDDQYSVVSYSSAQIGTLTISEYATALSANLGSIISGTVSEIAMSLNLTINSVAVGVRFVYSMTAVSASLADQTSWGAVTTSLATGASIAAGIVAAVNNNVSLASQNITARMVGSEGWTIERTGGGQLKMLISMNGSTAGQVIGGSAAGGFSYIMAGASNGTTTVSLGSINGGVSLLSLIGDGATFASIASAPTLYNGESSAVAKAVAINAVKATSQVTATARANVITAASAVAAGSFTSGAVYINGVNIGAVTTIANDGNGALVSAINAQTTSTGVTATTDANGKLVMTASDGRNITITAVQDATTFTSTVGTTMLGIDAANFAGITAIFRSTVRLTSESEISLSGTLGDLYDGGTTAAQNNTKTTATTATAAVDQLTYNVSKVKLDTQDNAQAAMLTIDAAFNDVNLLRSQIGAIQNRLEFTISNLESASENFSASESRIRDADFAYETSRLTRNQILVQAGTAMVAQANTLPQVALQLLK